MMQFDIKDQSFYRLMSKALKYKSPYFMKSAVLFVFLSTLFFACENNGEIQRADQSLSEKERSAKIESILQNCQITISDIDNTLQYNEDTVKLDQYFMAFSGSTRIRVRKRGVLLENNKVVTSLSVSGDDNTTNTAPSTGASTYVAIRNTVYVALFDGTEKKLINSHSLGSYLSVVSVIADESDSSIIEISALVRSASAPASEIKTFRIELTEDTFTILE